MSYVEAFIELMTNPDSPLSDMKVYSMFDVGSLLGCLFNWLWMAIGKGLSIFIDTMAKFANYCYNFLSFSHNEAFVELYDVINTYVTIPLGICLVIIFFKYAIGDINKTSNKRFVKNFLTVLLVLCVMPSVFSFMNNTIIGEDFLNKVGGSGLSIADLTLKQNTTDYLYLYQANDKDNSAHPNLLRETFPVDQSPDSQDGDINNTDEIIEQLNKLKSDYPNSSFAANVTFSSMRFDFNQILKDGENEYKCPKLYQYKVTGLQMELSDFDEESTDTSSLYLLTSMNTEGVLGTGVGSEAYKRYNIDFVTVFLQMFATAIMYFCVGFSVLKLVYELLIHQLFGPVMAAIDLTGGDRIKKYLTSIIGCYAGLLISAIVIKLYNYACGELKNIVPDNGLIRAMMMVCLAIIFLDGPNIIAKYFGINTGVHGGMFAAGLAMNKAGHLASTVTAPIREGTNIGKNMGMNAINNRARERSAAARDKARETESINQRNAQNADKYNKQMGAFGAKYGTMGDFEKYQNPLSMDEANPGSDNNKNALTQKAAMYSAMSDMSGREMTPMSAKNSALVDGKTSSADALSMRDVGKSDIRDAKHGVYTGIANVAEQAGGTKSDYVNAANKAISAMDMIPNTNKKEYADFVADASMNAQHTDELRTQARNYKALDNKKNEVECYVEAMTNSGYGFSKANMESIARAELRDNGSLSDGNVYSNRPEKPFTYRPNTQTRGLQ